jgi:hypothetical protein
MKTLSCHCASVALVLSLFLSAGQLARATISVDATSSFGSVTIDPSSGASVTYPTALQSSAFAQAGANGQYNSGASSTASSSDTPPNGGLATGSGTSSMSPLAGSSGATGWIPLNTVGFDTSTGRASANGVFEITGVSGPVNVTFSTEITGNLTLSSNPYGVYGEGENVFSLSLIGNSIPNGTPILFHDQILSIGPNQSQSGSFSDLLLKTTMSLMPNTPYNLWVESDSEAMVLF